MAGCAEDGVLVKEEASRTRRRPTSSARRESRRGDGVRDRDAQGEPVVGGARRREALRRDLRREAQLLASSEPGPPSRRERRVRGLSESKVRLGREPTQVARPRRQSNGSEPLNSITGFSKLLSTGDGHDGAPADLHAISYERRTAAVVTKSSTCRARAGSRATARSWTCGRRRGGVETRARRRGKTLRSTATCGGIPRCMRPTS